MEKFIKFLLNVCTCIFVVYGGFCGVAVACESNEIDVLGDGTQCKLAKFSITTTNMNADTTFAFYMSAKGTFYVDWGDGTVDKITRTDTNESLYDHKFTTGGPKTIRYGGLATGYSTSSTEDVAAIRFGGDGTDMATPTLISSLSGSIGQIFQTLGYNGGQYAVWRYTFRNCSNLTTLPMNLFSGATCARFTETFRNCTNIQSIPELFTELKFFVNNMFSGTFWGCSSLTSIPENLFSFNIPGGASIFNNTFRDCIGLISIPENLFINIGCNSSGVFTATFAGCTGLTSIPEKLFQSCIYAGLYTFHSTFSGCTGLTSIPENLFSTIQNFGTGTFVYTFSGCKNLTSIPPKLFQNVKNARETLFYSTFSGCTGLRGYIPPELFANLNGAYGNNMMWQLFFNTNLATSCPSGTVQFVTGYEQYWDGRVSCIDENLVCGPGEYFHAHDYKCSTCPENNYCVGGTYPYSETVSAGATQCPNNSYSNEGASSIAQCWRILHVGDANMYLHGAKTTTPSLNFDLDNDGTPDFFSNMTTADVPMNINTERKLKINYNGQNYSVYDDTVTVPE